MTFNEIKQLALKGNVRAKFIYACSLIDGKYEKDLRDLSLRFRGSQNQRIIDVQKTILEGKIVEIS